MATEGAPRLYDELAGWFHLLTAPEDYAEEAEVYRSMLLGVAEIPVRAVLELGSGGGNNASHLKAHFDMTLVDISPAMLEASRTINQECRHLQGDMRSVRLGESFDAVFVHDAVAYMTTRADLGALAATARIHCRAGGAVLFVPDFVAETFRERTDHGGHDGEGRSIRYLEWCWDPDPTDTSYLADMAYLMRDEDGITVARDRHVLGVFPIQTWLDVLTAAGFSAQYVTRELSDGESLDMFVGVAGRSGA
jgi:SAM-dependent methyltransferase